MRINTTLATALLSGLLILAGCTGSQSPDCAGIELSDSWVREAPPGVGVQAGYFELTNASGKQVVVHGVQSPDFGRVEMHETVTTDGSSKMRSLADFTIPPRSSVEFKAGGKHLMLFQPRLPYVAGDRVQLQFVCGENRAHMPVAVEVRRAAPSGEAAAD